MRYDVTHTCEPCDYPAGHHVSGDFVNNSYLLDQLCGYLQNAPKALADFENVTSFLFAEAMRYAYTQADTTAENTISLIITTGTHAHTTYIARYDTDS